MRTVWNMKFMQLFTKDTFISLQYIVSLTKDIYVSVSFELLKQHLKHIHKVNEFEYTISYSDIDINKYNCHMFICIFILHIDAFSYY